MATGALAIVASPFLRLIGVPVFVSGVVEHAGVYARLVEYAEPNALRKAGFRLDYSRDGRSRSFRVTDLYTRAGCDDVCITHDGRNIVLRGRDLPGCYKYKAGHLRWRFDLDGHTASCSGANCGEALVPGLSMPLKKVKAHGIGTEQLVCGTTSDDSLGLLSRIGLNSW